MANNYLPVSWAISGRSCLVVGGGLVAVRKVETLLDYKADVTVVAPDLDSKLEYFGERGQVKVKKREYKIGEATEFDIVVAASNDQDLNKQVYDDTRSSRTVCNVVDNPPLCDFIFPAIVKRDTLTVAVSTDGTAPFLAGHLRLILENVFPQHWEELMSLAGQFRTQVQQRWKDDAGRRNLCYERFLEADWKTLLKEKDSGEINAELERMLSF
jgi:uroporphyrin-III C-methyltransferase/precorrin-2 dehydrogenase/sirohydrochlorin ferrochelatase